MTTPEQRALWELMYGDTWWRVNPDGTVEQLDPANIEHRDDGSYIEHIAKGACHP